MRRVVLFAVPLALLLAGCGGETVSPVAETVVGKVSTPTTTTAAPTLPTGHAAAGAQVFQTAGCGACHTLAAAKSTGTVGPDLDKLAPDLAAIEKQVINGGNGMPPFKGSLSDQQIADVSQYVYESTH